MKSIPFILLSCRVAFFVDDSSHRIASLLSPVGMCQYKGKVEEPPTTVALRRPLIFGASPDLLLILSSHTHRIQHTLLCTLEL